MTSAARPGQATGRDATAWPDPAWKSAWLAGMSDPSSRQQLEAAGSVRRLAKGAYVFRVGEAASAFFVVAEGLVDVRGTRRGETTVGTVRRAIAGDAVGEEAIVRPGAPRGSEAMCGTDAVLVEVPLGVFRRVASRNGAGGATEVEARLRRSAMRDALRVSSLGASLTEEGVRELAAAADERVVDRGDTIVAQGDPADRVLVVADGMVQATRTEDGRASVRAYLGRGDVLGEEAGERVHEVTVTACGPAWVLLLDRERVRRWAGRAHGALTTSAARPAQGSGRDTRLRRLPLLGEPSVATATRHVTQDLWRFAVAGSMLVIDDEACVRCGQCVSACAGSHGDGVSRLVRRGEKVAVHDAVDGSARALVLPGSCQHCRNPVCMRDCPTGAIEREADGGVLVREDLCVGCGACAKACPWGSVTMAPRPRGTIGRHEAVPRPDELGAHETAGPSELVAVKCDGCHGIESGPRCVAACPVDAIARVDPAASFAEVHERVAPGTPRRSLPRRRSSAEWAVAAATVAVAVARVQVTSYGTRLRTGIAAGALVAVLVSYAVVKRAARLRWMTTPGRSSVRWHAIAHVAVGLLAAGVVAAHVGARVPANAAGALLVAFAMASLTGACVALVYRLLPGALARSERQAMLLEDLPARARDLDERVFGLLTGRSAAEKAIYERILAPYARASLGGVWLATSGRTLRAEEARLRARIERVVGAARAAQMEGLGDLVRWAVERRASGAQRLLQSVMRAVLPVHVVAVAASLALLALHVWSVARGR
jgi:Fe-S-cluster-containing dehydrogenase component/CRP-like cAMP-binding protein